MKIVSTILTLIWVGFLGVRFEVERAGVGGWGVKLPLNQRFLAKIVPLLKAMV